MSYFIQTTPLLYTDNTTMLLPLPRAAFASFTLIERNRASMGDDYADETNVAVRITDESPVEEIYDNFNSNDDNYSSNETYADNSIDGESPEIYEMDLRMLLLSTIPLGSLLYHLRLLHPFFLSLYGIVFALYSCIILHFSCLGQSKRGIV